MVTRGLAVALTQENNYTIVSVKRYLDIITVRSSSPLPSRVNFTESPEEFAKAMAEVGAVVAQLPERRRGSVGTDEIDTPSTELLGDNKNLIVRASKILLLTRELKKESNTTYPSISLKRHIMLREELPTYVTGLEKTSTRGYEQRDRIIRLARMELQGAMETMRPFARNFRRLEPATTGMTEAPARPECEYCSSEHRNGDCLLPRAPFV